MKTGIRFALLALLGGMLLVGVPALAQEGAGIFKSETGEQIAPDQGWIENQRFYGEYDDDASDNWFYDRYTWEEVSPESEVRGYYGGENALGWYSERNYYTGTYEGAPDEDDWFFDAYEDTGDRGLWDY